ncbi:MAG: helix-turn-helix transcriptional regulator, partial [Clostridia bacterium]|nr:helix-turn-helix transcriptional regulator [Clostridia bacterium]
LNIELIQRTMQEKGLTVKQLAEKSGITARRLKRYINGESLGRTPFDVGLAFYDILGITFEDMMLEVADDKKDGK